MSFFDHLGHAALMSVGMMWQTGWSLVLGFTVSALLQVTVRSEDLQRALGGSGPKELALASAAGAASSSCSYASAAITRTLLDKGVALATALAFMIASTNLVLELGLILLTLLGWRFMLGQWIGGIAMIVIVTALVRLTTPHGLIDAARKHGSGGGGHMSMQAEGETWFARVGNPQTRINLARSFAMEWRMLWKDLAIGFVVGGLVSAFVPDAVWQALFLHGHSPWLAVPIDVLVGPLVAMVTFVCSVGNVPLAAVLWAGGASFAGVLSFIYADLIVLPLLDTYRRYYGWRMAAYLFAVLFAAMALAGALVDVGFHLAHLNPTVRGDVRAGLTHFALNYTFWLNIAFGALASWLFWTNYRHPLHQGHHACCD